jgi:hypothetical protein
MPLSHSTLGLASQQYTSLQFVIYPGSSSGSGAVYEDDGATTAYVGGAFATTECTYATSSGSTIVKIVTTGQ